MTSRALVLRGAGGVIALLALSRAGLGCGGGSSGGGPDASIGTGAVAGAVTDVQGKPIAGVRVALGSQQALSGSDGAYTLSGLAPQSGAVVTYTKSGYLEMAKRPNVVAGLSTPVDAVLAAMGAPQSLDGAAGGKVTGVRGTTLTASAGAFVDASGKAVTGTVDVYLTPLDPAVARERAAYPGVLVGVNATGKAVPLQTFGVVDVTVEQGGQKLQIASGKSVTATFPATVGWTAPSSTNLWSFDTTTALWKYEGTTTQSGGSYTAELHHLSTWNADQEFANGTTCLTGRVVDASGNVVYDAQVVPMGVGYSLLDEDSMGEFTGRASHTYCVWVKSNSEVLLEAVTPGPTSTGVGTVQTKAGPGVPFEFDCTQVSDCEAVPDIVLGYAQTVAPDAGPPSCGTSSATGPAGDGGTTEGGASDPFQGTCAEPLAALGQCFDATGGCTMTEPGPSASTQITLQYGSGSSLQVVANGDVESLTFFGDSHQVCATGTVLTLNQTLTLTLTSGGTFVIGQETLTCPDGTVLRLSADQASALSGCQSIGGGGLGGCRGGTDAGSGSTFTCYSTSGGTTACETYVGLPASALAQAEQGCTNQGGQLLASCPTAGRTGCCAYPGGSLTICYYAIAAAQAQLACAQSNGTYTPG